jgi:DNA-binding NarL/FixJ family response regulator
VLTLIIDGLGNREVAARLNLSVRTVEKHRQRIMRKLGVCRATELLKLAVTRGWVNLNPLEGV